MPTSLSFEQHGEGLGDAWTVLRENAARAGVGAAVPTCPGWDVRDLVAHQGMVHRWATSVLRGETVEDTGPLELEGRAAVDLLGWLDDGMKELLAALAFAPDDLRVFFFLKDAPSPKLAWARRQCHETVIHAVDAMSARLRRCPTAAETWVRPALAADGVDELLCGFAPRRTVTLRSAEPRTVVVRATDTGDEWTLALSAGPVVTTVTTGAAEAGAPPAQHGIPGSPAEAVEQAVTVLSGTAAQLYLGLWNRGDEITETGPGFLGTWRQHLTVTW